jgi:hypothetical protein
MKGIRVVEEAKKGLNELVACYRQRQKSRRQRGEGKG